MSSNDTQQIPVGTRVRVKINAPTEDDVALGKTGTLMAYKAAGHGYYAALAFDEPIENWSGLWLVMPEALEVL